MNPASLTRASDLQFGVLGDDGLEHEIGDLRGVGVEVCDVDLCEPRLQGYLPHKKPPTPLGPPQGPRHSPTIEF